MDKSPRHERFRFGRFEVQPRERRLLADGTVTPITPRAFDLLVVLIERAGELVEKDELLDRVWSGLVVEESNLPVQVSTLRRLLGPRSIATVPGRGYRFMPEVAVTAAGEPAPAGNLPEPITPMVDSRGMVDRCVAALRATQLITLTGPGGVGKSRLLLETARACSDDYRDGAWAVDVSTAPDLPGLEQLVANVLCIADASRTGIATHVARRCMLLALDNCEHLVQDVADLADRLLRASPRLAVLASSRERLRVAGERLVYVAPLPVPEVESATPEALANVDSVRLFMSHAAAALPGFALTATNAAPIARICRELEGLPLALVHAAPLVRAMSPLQIAEHLSDPLDFLKAADPTVAPHQRTLRASLDWSYEPLAPEERACLRRLACLPCAWTLEAALAALTGGAGNESDWVTLHGRLVEKSLVTFDSDTGRYQMLGLVRRHARERMDAGDAP